MDFTTDVFDVFDHDENFREIMKRLLEASIAESFNGVLITEAGPGYPIVYANAAFCEMTGYRPDYLFLKQVGIDFNKDVEAIPCFDPETFETNLKGIYLAGVVCGGMNTSKWFIENAREHPQKIFDHITNKTNENKQ